MARSGGTYTAPSNSFNPAVEGSTIDEGDWNTTLDDLEAALTESTYTAGLGSTDNQLVRTDGTDGKKVQSTGITVDDSNNVSGVVGITATTVNIGAADTTLARSGAGDITVEGNAIYRAGGTDVPIADGGTGASTAAAGARALLDGLGTTQGQIIYRDGSQWTTLNPGSAGQVLQSGGGGANPSWTTVAGTGDVTAAANFGTDNVVLRADGTGKGAQASTVSIDDSGNVTGVASIVVANDGLKTKDSDASHNLIISTDSNLTADRTLNLNTGDASRSLTIGADSSISGTAYVGGGSDVALADGGTGASLTDPNADRILFWDDSAGQVTWLEAGSGLSISGTTITATGSGGGAPSIPQGRITLTSATPVLTADVTAATTVYYSPYVGRYVPIYSGSSWSMVDIGGELSQATTDSTKSPAACTTNSNYDLFVWSDSGTYRCTRGPAWSSDTSRGTGAGTSELERIAGIWTNKVAITNGPGANLGTYVGTIRTNGSSQVDFKFGGTAAGGSAAIAGVWNAYNRVLLTFLSRDSTSSWTYNSTTTRSMNNSTGNRISMVRGLDEDHVASSVNLTFSGGASGDYQFGVALDSTSSMNQAGYGSFGTSTAPGNVSYTVKPGLGWHYLQAVERQVTTVSTAQGFGVLGSQQVQQFSATMMV